MFLKNARLSVLAALIGFVPAALAQRNAVDAVSCCNAVRNRTGFIRYPLGTIGAYYAIRFSEPCAASGTIDASGTITDGADQIKGTGSGMYARFEASTATIDILLP